MKNITIRTYWRTDANPFPGELVYTETFTGKRPKPRSRVRAMTEAMLESYNARERVEAEKFERLVDAAQLQDGFARSSDR